MEIKKVANSIESVRKIAKKVIEAPETPKIVSLVVLAMLMSLPFGMNKADLINTAERSALFFPFTVLFSGAVQQGFNFLYISCFSFFLLPVPFILIVVSFFQKKISNGIIYPFVLVSVSMYLAAAVSAMILFANTPRWFYSLHFSIYVAFFTALVFHFILITKGIISIKTQNEFYAEYRRLLKEEEKKELASQKRLIKKLKSQKVTGNDFKEDFLAVKTALENSITNLKNTKKKSYIKIKITIVILITMIVMLSTFIYIDLRNYKMLLSQTVNNTGKNQAEQVAAIYGFSEGLHAKISAFLEGIKKTNATSPFPFERVDIITTKNKTPIYFEEINDSTIFPLFDVFSYTTEAGRVREIPSEEKRILPEEAQLYMRYLQDDYKEPVFNPEKNRYLYAYPVSFSKKEGQRLLGFSVVTYSKEILDSPYFQAKVFIFSISAVFLYASIIITLFLADFIANPIIFLCGNIRKTSNILGKMLSGNAKIEADNLIFEENITTHDEIKKLSIEIKNIVSLVRGMLPYVSFHTVQNAEKNTGRRSTTRDLCFLFTDIRGFTTLCENMQPKEVIQILNRYLDLETKIIFDNGGDVDKYVGDEIMAFFSGPKKEINACKAAMQIRQAMHIEKEAAEKEGGAAISIGIGINSGPVVFGSVGSETRKDFTSIGDTVNLAARLEGANKEYGSKSIISEAVYENLNGSFVCRELDFLTVKGKTEPVRIFEILQSTDSATEKIHDLKRIFEEGLSQYRKKNWKAAEKCFSEGIEKYDDAPSKVFLKRVLHYQITPPEQDWKGVFVMNVK